MIPPTRPLRSCRQRRRLAFLCNHSRSASTGERSAPPSWRSRKAASRPKVCQRIVLVGGPRRFRRPFRARRWEGSSRVRPAGASKKGSERSASKGVGSRWRRGPAAGCRGGARRRGPRAGGPAAAPSWLVTMCQVSWKKLVLKAILGPGPQGDDAVGGPAERQAVVQAAIFRQRLRGFGGRLIIPIPHKDRVASNEVRGAADLVKLFATAMEWYTRSRHNTPIHVKPFLQGGAHSRREFHFQMGLRGNSGRSRWRGRIHRAVRPPGHGRPTQTKEYASEGAARAAADKLVAEKTKKGYVEVTAPAVATAGRAPSRCGETAEIGAGHRRAGRNAGRGRADCHAHDRPRPPRLALGELATAAAGAPATPPPFDLKEIARPFRGRGHGPVGLVELVRTTPTAAVVPRGGALLVCRGQRLPQRRSHARKAGGEAPAKHHFDGACLSPTWPRASKGGTEPGFDRQFEQVGKSSPT